MKTIFTLSFFLSWTLIFGQQIIDSGFPFQTETLKKYSIYVPSTYDEGTANHLMLGLHPLNTNRWDSQAWRDTLINFAEMNDLLLVCPDGGPDGRIDDAIDTAFTSVLLDSVGHWFNVDRSNQYIMGFSWGGLTSYTYGLRNTDKFQGYLIIGAAINGTGPINNILHNAENEAFYLVHGSNDLMSTRFTPLKNALETNNACVETNVLQGVGHTIDFPMRNEILTVAFKWLQTSACGISSIKDGEISNPINIYPNPSSDKITIEGLNADTDIKIYNFQGATIGFERNDNTLYLNGVSPGLYIINLNSKGNNRSVKIFVE